MPRFRRLALARLVLSFFFSANLLSQPIFLTRPTHAAEQTPPFAPPWGPTQERVPQEVKDKEKETPLAWCDNQQNQQFEVTYVDANTGTRTTIRRQQVPLPDGKTTKIVWEITTQEPGQPKRKVTYDLEPGKETRTERVGKEKPTTRPIREGDMFDPKKPPPTKKSSLTPAFPSTQLARVDFRASDPLAPGQGESRAAYDLRTLLAATLERSKGESLKTQERSQPPTLNIKIVTYGDPPQTPPVIHLDDPPQTTPEEFVQNPPPVTWTPGDGEGPKTTPEDPKTGVPVTYTPGTAINVGSGWASTRITKDIVSSCMGEDEEDGTQASSQPRETPGSTSRPRVPAPAPAPTKEETTPTTVASAPKQACVWMTVARTDVPDLASMLREREARADSAIADGVSDPARAQQQCPVRGSMFRSPRFFPGELLASRATGGLGAGTLSRRASPNGEMYALASADPGPTVTSPTGPLPERKFGENRTDDVLIPERNRINDIQDQMTRNAGRDDHLQGDSWTRLQNSVEWATSAIRNCNREQLQFALDGILASTRRLQERKEGLENLRDKVSAGLDKELGDLWKDVEALPKPIMEQSAGSKAATAGKIGLVLYELWRYFKHAHPPSPWLIPLDIYAVGSMFCTVSQWIDVKVQLKYNLPRLLDRLEKTNDLNLLIRQYEMRIEANQEAVNALGKLYDEHKCKKCVEPAGTTTEKPGTRPRTGSK